MTPQGGDNPLRTLARKHGAKLSSDTTAEEETPLQKMLREAREKAQAAAGSSTPAPSSGDIDLRNPDQPKPTKPDEAAPDWTDQFGIEAGGVLKIARGVVRSARAGWGDVKEQYEDIKKPGGKKRAALGLYHGAVDPILKVAPLMALPGPEQEAADMYDRARAEEVARNIRQNQTGDSLDREIAGEQAAKAEKMHRTVEGLKAAPQVAAMVAAGPISGAVERQVAGAVGKRIVGRLIARAAGHAAAGATFGATADLEDPIRGATSMAIIAPVLGEGGRLAGKGAAPVARTAIEAARRVLPEGSETVKLREELKTTKEQRDVAQREAETDDMTGLGNKRAYSRAKVKAEADPAISVVRFDVNGMKAVNDIAGHQAGDLAITSASDAMKKAAEELGIPARGFRVGGDELSAIVPAEKAEAFRNRVEELVGVKEHKGGAKSSVSGGVGATDAAADAAAYERKKIHKVEQGIVDPRAPGGAAVLRSPLEKMRQEAGLAPSPTVKSMPVDELHLDPERLQFKLGTNEKGVGRNLQSVTKYNPDLAGALTVWKDPANGKYYVVNGHHRYDLAKRTGTTHVDVRVIEAPTAEIARAKGAIANIAEGQGTALDAAKFFRDTGLGMEGLRSEGVDLSGRVAKAGMALSKLEPDVFSKVATGKISEAHGALIAALEDPVMQRTAAQLVEESPKRLTEGQVEELVNQVRSAGVENVTQDDLFGTSTKGESLVYHRADIASEIKRRLAADKKLFGFVTKGTRAAELERGGNVIDAETSGQIARESAILEEVFNSEAHAAGSVGSAITEAARRVANGEPVRKVVDSIYEPVREAVREAIPRAAAGRGAPPERGGAVGEPPPEAVSAGSGSAESVPGEVAPPPDPNQADIFGTPPTEVPPVTPRAEAPPEAIPAVEPPAPPPARPEVPAGTKVRSAAYMADDGTVFEGRNHNEAQKKAHAAGKAEDPDLGLIDEAGDGFTMDAIDPATGEPIFVDRQHGYDLAEAVDQLRPENTRAHPEQRTLGSEDLPYGGAAHEPPVPPEAPPAAAAAPAPRGKDYLNFAKFALDKTTEARVREAVARGRAEGTMDKAKQTFAQQRETARKFARDLLANPLDIDQAKLKNLTGAQIVGLHEVVGENTRIVEATSKAINSGDLTPAELVEASRLLDAATKSTNEALSAIVREKAETARGLGFFRQLARQSTDADVWLVHAKKMLGDRPMPDKVMIEIRRLAREATEACG